MDFDFLFFQDFPGFQGPVRTLFSMANSLISTDMLSTVCERYKNTFSKVIFYISCNKNSKGLSPRVTSVNREMSSSMSIENSK